MTFVLLCPRSGADVLAAEYSDFLQFTQLQEDELIQRPLDHAAAELGDMDGIEGVFIGGSPFTITAPTDPAWQESISRKLVDFISSQVAAGPKGIPVFSTCYGAAMLAHYLGGEVRPTYAESAGVSMAFLTDEGRKDPVTSRITSPFRVLTGHKDSVVALPPGATLLATSPQCPVQLYRLGDRVWTSQFHPEMNDKSIVRRLSFYEDAGYVSPADLQRVYAGFRGNDTRQANSLLKCFVDFCRGN